MTSGSFANRAFWVLASIALALLVLFLVVFVNWMNGLHSLREADADARARLAELKNAVTGVDKLELQEQSDRLDAILSVLELDLPQKAYVPTLLLQVETKALLTGNTHAEARLGEARPGEARPGPRRERGRPGRGLGDGPRLRDGHASRGARGAELHRGGPGRVRRPRRD